MSRPSLKSLAAGVMMLAGVAGAAAPAQATTIREFDAMTSRQRAQIFDDLAQAAIFNLEKNGKMAEAKCVSDLFYRVSTGESGAPDGIALFDNALAYARRQDPDQQTVRRVMAATILSLMKEHPHCAGNRQVQDPAAPKPQGGARK